MLILQRRVFHAFPCVYYKAASKCRTERLSQTSRILFTSWSKWNAGQAIATSERSWNCAGSTQNATSTNSILSIRRVPAALDHFKTFDGAFSDGVSKTDNDRMFQAFFCHLPLHAGSFVRKLGSESGGAIEGGVRVKLEFARKLSPVIGVNVAEVVLTANLHRYLYLVDVDVGVRQDAGHFIKGGEPDLSVGADQERVVLRVCIGAGNEPVVI
jgi:hypothetical protein